jgi:hypothetical protein
VVLAHISLQHQYCARFIVLAGHKSRSHARYFGYRLQILADTIKNQGVLPEIVFPLVRGCHTDPSYGKVDHSKIGKPEVALVLFLILRFFQVKRVLASMKILSSNTKAYQVAIHLLAYKIHHKDNSPHFTSYYQMTKITSGTQ